MYHYGHVATYASRTVVHESCAIRIDSGSRISPMTSTSGICRTADRKAV